MVDALELFVAFVIALVAVAYFVFASFAYGAGYQPTPRKVVERMLEFAQVGSNDRVFDLGAGTGAIVFRAARERGATVVGVEVEPIRILILRLRRLIGGPRGRVTVRWGNMFALDLTKADVVTCFLWPGAMQKLRPKFERELASGARVVSHWHPVPGWKATAVDPALHVYAYRWPTAMSAPDIEPATTPTE
jgi:ribosomal protein L11 methylase PrmA